VEKAILKLDFNPRTSAFTLTGDRTEMDVAALLREHGLNFSVPASTEKTAVLFTHEPYAACEWAPVATPRALEQLAPLLTQIEASRALDSGRHFDVPPDQELFGYQKASLAYAMERTHVLIADEPGLGKTPMAIAYANEIRARRILCIVPASIRIQWMHKIREWSTMVYPYGIHVIGNGKHGVNPDAQWTIVSYELAANPAIGRALASYNWDLLVLDEAHMLKTIDTRRTRAVFGGGLKREFPPFIEKTQHVVALTGTPLPNRPREAYTIARSLHWDSIDFMSEDAFKQRFNPSARREGTRPDGSTYVYNDERSGRHGELQSRMRVNFMTRHLKREVLPQLKLPQFDLIYLDPDGPIRAALAKEHLLDLDPETLSGKDVAILGDVSTVRKEMGVAMAPRVADHLADLIDGGEEKLVVFGHHIEVLDILEERLARYGVVRIDGRTSLKQREERKNQFIKDPETRFIIGNELSLGTGTDGLQLVATHALMAEPDWVFGNNKQCFDRLDRPGQLGQVQGDIFVVEGSFAEKVLSVALRKGQTTHKALDRVLTI
jgi:SWI/SNF-related matrix-associated actin-dependent regulator 1 of chromatin subfamily A